MASTSKSRTREAMNFRGPAMERFDRDFDDLLERMKPYVLKLPRKSGKCLSVDLFLCICWIKLNPPPLPPWGSGGGGGDFLN